jgi:hypothetical protein
MAIQSKSLSAAEHDWYATRSGAPANAPLSQHRRDYWEAKGSKNEQEWLQKVGSSVSIDPYELWVAACQAQTVTVGKSIDECKFNFFTTVASGTNP